MSHFARQPPRWTQLGRRLLLGVVLASVVAFGQSSPASLSLQTGDESASVPANPERKVITLEWIASDDCRMASVVESSVQRLVRNFPVVPQPVRVTISQTAGTWSADLDLRLGKRRLEGTSCEELVETMAVVIALAVDQSNASATSPESPAAPVAATSPAGEAKKDGKSSRDENAAKPNQPATHDSPQHDDAQVVVTMPKAKLIIADSTARKPTTQRTARRRESAFSVGVGPGVTGEIGVLPHAAVAGSLGLRIAERSWALRARGAAFVSQQARQADRSVGSIALRVAAVEPCIQTGWFRERWDVCATLEYGSMSGSGKDTLQQGSSGSTYWFSLGGHLGWRRQLMKHLVVEPRLGASFPLTHPAFRIEQGQVVHRVGIVSGRVELILWLEF